MAVKAAQVTVATASTTSIFKASANREYVLVRNDDATNSVFLGPSGVTTTTGFELPAGATQPVWVGPTEELFGRAATADSVVHVLRTNAE